jgi:hypothetical protein
MTDDEARDHARRLTEHHGSPVLPAKAYCAALREWAKLFMASTTVRDYSEERRRELDRGFRDVELAITKSCLLDRMIHCGERPSQTPCPIHKGRWSGVHPPDAPYRPLDAFSAEIHGVAAGTTLYDAGCRCFLHGCGCTTGWNVDEHCGCSADQVRSRHSRAVQFVVLV